MIFASKKFLLFFNASRGSVRIIYYQCSRNNGELTMKLSTRTRYATRAVLELAEHFGKGPLQTRTIAKNQEISIKYLEQIMSALKSQMMLYFIKTPAMNARTINILNIK